MRNCCIGTETPEGGWRPKFAKRNPTLLAVSDKENQRKSRPMSYFPTHKGERRQERLRLPWHVGMATLLETDPNVRFWTTETTGARVFHNEQSVEFASDIWVEARGGNRAIILINGGDDARERRLERDDELRKHYGQDGGHVMVLTREEVETHPLLNAAEAILYHRCWEVPEDYLLRVAAMVDCPPATLGELHAILGLEQASWQQMLALVGRGAVEIEMSGKLDPSTVIVACQAVEAF